MVSDHPGCLPADGYRQEPTGPATLTMTKKRTMSTEIAIALKLYKYQSNMQQQGW